jgi:hypothetical protein
MNLTIAFIIFLVVIVAVFDVYIIAKKGKQESISAHIIRISHKYPSITFLLGFLCGHLFWRMNDIAVFGEVLK